MDIDELVEEVLYLQKHSNELLIRLFNWSVKTAEDRDAVRHDVGEVTYWADRLKERVGMS